ncbi:MAG: redoxin domain-containing protein [Hyphomicrobiaceae bacterium]|nr:redoxin domain-containing protein [Hyphomicrobiaceae bacterium]
MALEPAPRRRRRSHLIAAALVLVVIVAAGVVLEKMPGSGPTVATAPQQSASSGVTPFGQAFAKGIEAMRLGDAHTAARAFDEARAINPHIPEAHVNLGFAFLAMQRPREAATAFDRALSIDAKQINAYYGLGAALDASGDRKGAIGAMRTFVHLSDKKDPFQRKAMSALWEWEAAENGATPQQGEADAKSKPEAAAAKDAAAGETTASIEQQGGAGTGAKPEAVATKDTAAAEAPAPSEQKGEAGAKAESTAVAMLDTARRNNAPVPPPLPAIADMPDALTPPEGVISIVNVWASWCGPCRAELPSLQAFAAALDPSRYRLVGLNVDRDRDFAREFIRDTAVSFGNFWDGRGVFAKARFQVEAYPQTLFLDSSGAVIARVSGTREWPADAAEATVAEILASGQKKEPK